MRDLMAVIVNEWMKLLRRKRFTVTAILSLLVVGLFGITAYHQYHNDLQYNPIAFQQQQVAQLKQQIATLKSQPSSNNRDSMLQQLNQQLVSTEQNLNQLQQTQTGDWKAPLRQQIASNEAVIQRLGGSKNAPDVAQVENARGQVMQMQYSLDHNVRPLGWPSINAFSQMTSFMSVFARIFLPMLVVILVADMISGESTDGTIKLLLIRPVSRVKVLLGKWMVGLITACIWSLGLCALLLCTAFAIMGTRGGSQPVAVNVYTTVESYVDPGQMGGISQVWITHYDHATFVSEWHFMLIGFLYTALSMLVVATIAILCSTIFRSTMVSTAAAMGTIIVGFIVMQMGRHESWVNWLFPTHLSLMDDWSGQLSAMLQQKVDLVLGLGVLGVWAIIALITSLVHFHRRDVLNA